MATVKATAFRFTDEDLAIIDAIQQYTGTGTRIDALRVALRGYQRAEGIEVPRSKGARKGGK
jgi:hypothetical protein